MKAFMKMLLLGRLKSVLPELLTQKSTDVDLEVYVMVRSMLY